LISASSKNLVLNSKIDVTCFNSGVSELDTFIQKYALQSQASHSTRTYAFIKDELLAGYFSLAFGSVSPERTPRRVSSGMGRYPIPVMVLARLAVDKRFQGIGIGECLLKDAFRRTIKASEIAGLRAMFVVAKNEKAKKFYQKYQFIDSDVDDFHLYLLMKDILKSI
jgi:GNAT superfamily N-acetyltransferase